MPDLPNETDFGNVRAATINADQMFMGGVAALDATARIRSTPVKVALFGDSQSSPGELTSPISHDYRAITAANWQNGLVQFTSSFNKWSTGALYPQAYVVFGGGIGGQTSTDMLTRDALATSINRRAIRDMLDFDPDVVIWRGASINNLVGITTQAGLATTVAATMADDAEIAARFALAGLPVLVVGIYGYSGTVGNPYPGDPALIRQALVQVNDNLRRLAIAYPNFIYIDPVGIVSDAAGNFLSSRYYGSNGIDVGVHLADLGGYLMSQAEATALTKLFGPSANARYRGVNLVADPLMITAPVSQSFGTVAAGYTIGASNASRANAKIELMNGKKMQTVEITATAAAGSGTIVLPFNPTATGLNPAIGDTYGIEFDVYVAPITPTAINGNVARLDIRDSVGSGRILFEMAPGYDNVLDRPISRHVVIPPVKFGDTGANLTTASELRFGVNNLALGETMKLGVGGYRIVKL